MGISGYTIVNGEKRYITDEGYWDIENGCEFEAREGFTYELMFQYNTYDGRNPEFTFYVESEDWSPNNPKTGDGAFLPVGMMVVSAMLAVWLFTLRKKML